jgi:predicted PurR-regulated permease PerM
VTPPDPSARPTAEPAGGAADAPADGDTSLHDPSPHQAAENRERGSDAGVAGPPRPVPTDGADHASWRDRVPDWVPRAIVLFWLGWLAVGVVTWGFGRLRSLLLLLLVAQFLAFAMEPPVNRLVSRGWKRGAATGVVMVGVFAGLTAFVAAIGSLLVNQVATLIDQAPEYLQSAEDWINSTFNASVDLQDWIDRLSDEGGPLQEWASEVAGQGWSIGSRAAGVLLQILSVALFAFYFCADGPRLRRALFSRFPPHRQVELARAFDTAIEKTGGYLNSRALLALISGVFHFLFFTALELPYPAAMALWVGVISQFIPTIGTYLAAVLPVVVALAERPVLAIWVIVFELLYQQVENYLFAPRITARTVDIHPAVAFAAVIAGAALFGAIGALLAIPIAATVQSFLSSYLGRYEVIDSHLTRENPFRFRRKKRKGPPAAPTPEGI